MSKHTPGPWEIERPPHDGPTSALIQKNPDAIHVVSYGTIWGFGVSIAALGQQEEEETNANANLIAAVPVLLAALEGLCKTGYTLKYVRGEGYYCLCCEAMPQNKVADYQHEDDCPVTVGRAAIRKAKGNG